MLGSRVSRDLNVQPRCEAYCAVLPYLREWPVGRFEAGVAGKEALEGGDAPLRGPIALWC